MKQQHRLEGQGQAKDKDRENIDDTHPVTTAPDEEPSGQQGHLRDSDQAYGKNSNVIKK